MAINNDTLEVLENNKEIIKWKNVLMIWRQDNSLTKKIIKRLNFMENEIYTEKLWKFLWCKNIQSLDSSNYEKSDFIHDMNIDIDTNKSINDKFDIVFDWWSSEHIYNIPTVFSNYKKLIKKDWYYIWVLPSNNWCNHWFYQFSPDFFYRVFSNEEWFETKVFVKINKNWFLVNDLKYLDKPMHFNLFLWNKPALVYVVSKKIKEVNYNNFIPSQTIFNNWLWENKKWSSTEKNKYNSLISIAKKLLPEFIKTKLWQMQNQKLVLEKLKFPTF